uniref:Uncharacterized protein n=1 Tax=Pseudomonas fluorescens (strain SBW25) TaxID=216595 RepID=A0A0G4E509_PSEFS|nr:hypothetical protein [Pseudomonas fluorescens]CEK42027.1 hypothetical protein PQBR57_0074 [Pseudomonas fluorescens SBW25]
MKKTLIGLAVALTVANAHATAYSDAAMASSEGLSVFDRVYEAGKAQSVTGTVKFQKTQPTPAAVIDLSLDAPVVSVEETATERKYRDVLADLEKNRVRLDAARAEAERVVQSAHAEVLAKANERVNILETQRNSIQGQLAQIKEQETRINQALALNDSAMAEASKMKVDGANQVALIKQESKQILMMAENSAVAIETAAKKRVQMERIDPTVVLNEPVKAEYQSATMEQIARGMMPQGWRIQVEFSSRPELADRRYQFISTDPRDLALRKLTASVRDARVRFAYFWDLTDSDGNPAPMLLITDRAK